MAGQSLYNPGWLCQYFNLTADFDGMSIFRTQTMDKLSIVTIFCMVSLGSSDTAFEYQVSHFPNLQCIQWIQRYLVNRKSLAGMYFRNINNQWIRLFGFDLWPNARQILDEQIFSRKNALHHGNKTAYYFYTKRESWPGAICGQNAHPLVPCPILMIEFKLNYYLW